MADREKFIFEKLTFVKNYIIFKVVYASPPFGGSRFRVARSPKGFPCNTPPTFFVSAKLLTQFLLSGTKKTSIYLFALNDICPENLLGTAASMPPKKDVEVVMTFVALLGKIKKYGIRGSISKIKGRRINERIKEFDKIKKYFQNKTGLEIGGPSGAFRNRGYMPVYKIIGTLDGVNFSSSTVWTGKIENDKGFTIDGKNVGKMYIADATDLTQIQNNTYDFILSSNNIEHIANPLKAMEQWISKLKQNGVLVMVAPRKEVNFDHKRDTVKFAHLLDDYNNGIDEHDLTHLEEILRLHDLPMDTPAGTFEQFKERSLKNYENRCLHHHVFDLKVLEQMCNYFKLTPILMDEEEGDYIIVAKK
jgi:SAM-dependent methyltransferase